MTDSIVIHHGGNKTLKRLITALIVVVLLMGFGILQLAMDVSRLASAAGVRGRQIQTLSDRLDATNADNARKDHLLAQKDARIMQLTDQLIRLGFVPVAPASVKVVQAPQPTFVAPQPAPAPSRAPSPSPAPRPTPSQSTRPRPTPTATPTTTPTCSLSLLGVCVVPK